MTGNTCGSSDDLDLALTADCPSSSGGNGPEHVFYFVLPSTSAVGFNGCNTGSNYDQSAYVRRVCTDPALSNQAACNDDGCGGSPGCTSRYRSAIPSTSMPAGSTSSSRTASAALP